MGQERRSASYHVDRDILDEQSLEDLAQRLDSGRKPHLTERLKHSLRCSVPWLKRSLVRCLPVLYWMPRYSIWDYGMGDLIAGITMGIVQMPQSMAYALLASLPPVFGLYTSLYPVLVYFFFGTSRHISVGTSAVLSIMVGSVTERLAPDHHFLMRNGTNVTLVVDEAARDSYRVTVAVATTVLGGIIQVVLGLVRFGFVATYLSEPLVRGYTSAAACHAAVAQLRYLVGLSSTRFVGPLSLVYTLGDVCSRLHQAHVPTLVVGLLSFLVIFSAKELNASLSKKLPVPIPVELLSDVHCGTVISIFYLHNNICLSLIWCLSACRLLPPRVPQTSLFREVIGDAFAMAVVGYALAISLGKTFALKHGYKVDSNQELVALGISNTVGGFFHCYSISSSMSRSLVQVTAGGKTQIAGVISAFIVLIAILKLGPLFQELPKAVLSAIVLVNLKGMFKQYYDIVALWRSSRIDLVVWLATWLFTLLFQLDMGLAASIAFALLTVVFRTQHPQYSVLGQVPGTEIYMDMEKYKEVHGVPGVTIFRSSATVYFANADLYLEALMEKSGINISKMIAYKKRQEAKQRRREKRAKRRAKRDIKRQKDAMRAAQSSDVVFSVEEETGKRKETDRQEDISGEEWDWAMRENGTVFVIPEVQNGHSSWEYLKGGDPDMGTLGSASELDGDTTTLTSSCDDTLSRDQERLSLGSLGKWTWDIHSIILDLSPANFIDTVAIKTMKTIIQDFGEIDVDVYMAGCQASVVEQLEQGDFFSDCISKGCLFATVHDAVLYCTGKHEALTMPPYDCVLVTKPTHTE
uniref:Solute carrier family 26 member 6, like 1 n=1 Tax=Scleropages formosus TaxID=113540 RepID=A0A8C9S2W6_SCLFO